MSTVVAQERQSDVTTLSVNVRMVEVYASVVDSKGRRVQDLEANSFEILEDGVKQTPHDFESQDSEANIAILLDTTSSMAPLLPQVKNAVSDLLDKLDAKDNAGLFTFNTKLNTIEPFTKDRNAIQAKLMQLRAEGGTALYDALAQLARDLSSNPGKNVILLFTDGLDNRSVLRMENATSAIRRIGVPIYTIAEGALLQDSEGLKRLKAIAADTNGIAFEAHGSSELTDIVSKINLDLRHLYLLGYYPNNTSNDSDWHHILIRVPGHPELRIRAKEGYSTKAPL
jgi:VWFA-related protein